MVDFSDSRSPQLEPHRASPRYPGAAPLDSSEEEGLSLTEIFGALRRHPWMILTAVLLSLSGTAYLLSKETVPYRAGAFIRLRAPAAVTAQLQPTDASRSAVPLDPLTSEMMVLQGHGVAGEVVDREGLRLMPPPGRLPGVVRDVEVTLPDSASAVLEVVYGPGGVTASLGEQRRSAPYGTPVVLDGVRFTVDRSPGAERETWSVVPRVAAGDILLEGLQVRPREGTDGVDVFYTAPSAARAAHLVNAMVEAYQEVNLRMAQQESTRRREFLHQQLQETDSLIADAQLALSRFRSSEQAYSAREKFGAQQSSIVQLEAEREAIAADRDLYRRVMQDLARESLEGAANRIGALLSYSGIGANPVIGQLASQLVQYERTRDSLIVVARRTPLHPAVAQMDVAADSTKVRLLSALRVHVAALDSRVAALDTRLARNVGQLEALSSAELSELQLVQRLETLRSIGDHLRQEYEKARMAEAVVMGQVDIVSPARGAMPVSSNRGLKLALGLMLGLAVGSGGALVREARNTSIRRRDDLQRMIHAPSLGVIPRIARPAPEGRALHRLLPARFRAAESTATAVAGVPPGSAAAAAAQGLQPSAEAYRILRNNVLYSESPRSLRSLVVTSASPGEGKTTTAINLAATLAQQGMRVLLVNCDLRRPRMEGPLQVRREPGLADVLLQEVDLGEAIVASGLANLSVLPCGKLPGRPFELLGGERMGSALAWLREQYDIVVLDSPPLLGASEAAVLAARADGVLLVVRAGLTERSAVRLAMEQLSMVGARVIGSVLNDPDSELPQNDRTYAYQYEEVG